SAAQALRNSEHIGVDVLTAKLGPRARRWAEAFSLVAVLAVSAILIVNGWHAAMFSRQLGILTEGQLELPAWMLQLLLPFGGALMGLVALESLVRLFSRR
ncbi:MAG TPA: TRAP transporter small permease, partial [Burkholderiales bacterium]|nr:TRAP transporter small permease [Burkholderiales bacterium]